jgi:WD40 repeat protein
MFNFGDLGDTRGLAVTPDSRLLVSSAAGDNIVVWDMISGKASTPGSVNYPGAIAVSPDSRILVYSNVGGEPFELRLLDLQSNQELDTLVAHPYPVSALAISPDERHLVSVCTTGEIKVWDWHVLKTYVVDPERTPTGARVWAHGITPDGRLGVSSTEDHALVVQELETGRYLYPPLQGHRDFVRGVRFTSDSRFAISGAQDGTLRMWDLHNGEQVLELPCYGWSLKHAFALLPGDQHVVASPKPGEVQIWDLQTGRAVGESIRVSNEVHAVLPTSDGRRVVVAAETTITLWDLETRQLLSTLESPHQSVHKLVISSDERYLFSFALYEPTIGAYDLQRSEVLPPLVGHSEWVRAVALTADGQYAISAANDGLIIVWDWRAAKEVRRLVGHTDWVYDMELTEDDRRVFSVSQDRTVRVWDWQTGEVLASTALPGILDRLRVAPNGQRLLVGDRTGSVCCLDYVQPTR